MKHALQHIALVLTVFPSCPLLKSDKSSAFPILTPNTLLTESSMKCTPAIVWLPGPLIALGWGGSGQCIGSSVYSMLYNNALHL